MMTRRSMPTAPAPRFMALLLLLLVGAIVLQPHAAAAQATGNALFAQEVLAWQIRACDEDVMWGYEELQKNRDDIDVLGGLLVVVSFRKIFVQEALAIADAAGIAADFESDIIKKAIRCLRRLRELEDRIKERIEELLPPSTEEPEETRRAREERRAYEERYEERQELLDQIEALMEQLLDYGKDK